MARQRALLTQHSSGQVPASGPGCCACYWTWCCQVDYLLLITGPSLRGLKDTWDFWLCCAWLFLKRCWVHQAASGGKPGLAPATLSLGMEQPAFALSHLSQWPGSRAPAPCSSGSERPCSVNSLHLSARPLLSEENDLSWQEENSRDFLEQRAEPALEERLAKKPGSNSLRLMPSCLFNDLDTIKRMET